MAKESNRPVGEPTSEELALAEAYMRLHISVSSTWTVGMERLLHEAMRDLCRLVWSMTGGRVNPLTFRYGMDTRLKREVDVILAKLLDDLRSLLESGLETLEEELSEGKSEQIALDLEDILEGFAEESESRLAAYFHFGLSATEMEDRMVAYAKIPWKDNLWRGALLAMGGNAAAKLLKEGGIEGSVGRSNVTMSKVRLYGETQMGEAIEREMLDSVDNPQWFCSLTADSTACDTCKEEEAKGWQPISNYSGLWHPYCRCRFVFR